MKYTKHKMAMILISALLLASGCGQQESDGGNTNQVYTEVTKIPEKTENNQKPGNKEEGRKPAGTKENMNQPASGTESPEKESQEDVPAAEISEDIYAGYSENVLEGFANVFVTCTEGSQGCYTMQGDTITFTKIAADSVYVISGEFKGNIMIDVGDDYKFDLELQGLSMSCDSTTPIVIKSGDKVSITAKKDYENYIYDMRAVVEEEDTSQKLATIYSEVDLKIGGKGALTVVSKNNNGIHSKKDLEVKNLTLTVSCMDNALKGNDSVSLEKATATLIAAAGDGIKTSNSDISQKGNQRGTISILGGTYTIMAACDGLDAAYDVVVENDAEAAAVLNIFTDKYSGYSKEITKVEENVNYIRFTSDVLKYSVKYYNSEQDIKWVNPEYHSKVSSGRTTYYYYSYPDMPEYTKAQFFVYSEDMQQGQETEYLAMTDALTINEAYDTFALAVKGENLSYSWTNYTTQINEGFGGFGGGRGGFGGGPGGFGDGNSDKGEYSTKGIKAGNEVVINSGTVNIKSYDDAVHANNSSQLESGAVAKGNVIINGGELSLYSNDDGLHADGSVIINGGIINISNSYEGVEGTYVEISGGKLTVKAKDDGINATTKTGTAVTISGGEIYIYCSGDGIDSNSRTSYEGIIFAGGDTVVISTSGMNSAIDTEQGYTYKGGRVAAVMPSGGMSREALHCNNFSEIGTNYSSKLNLEDYVNIEMGNEKVLTFRMPVGLNAMVVYLGSNNASVSVEETTSAQLDANGICWYK